MLHCLQEISEDPGNSILEFNEIGDIISVHVDLLNLGVLDISNRLVYN